jgi:hypothetical protein
VHEADSSSKSTKLVKITKMQNVGNGGNGRSGNPGGCFEPLTVFQNINLNKKCAFWFVRKSYLQILRHAPVEKYPTLTKENKAETPQIERGTVL